MDKKETSGNLEKEKSGITYPIRKLRVSENGITVFLENEKIQISDEAYFEFGIKNLKEIDEDLYRKLKDDEKLSKAYKGCLRKISMKDHTVKQIRDYLRQKQLNEAETDAMIEKLSSYGFLDDEKYCKGKIASLSASNCSFRQIRQKLLKCGISEQMISGYLKADVQEERHKARQVAKKYASGIRNRSVQMKKQMIRNKLIGQGFSYSAAADAVQSLEIADENELELLRRDYRKVRQRYEKKYEDRQLDSHIIASLLQKGFSYDDIKAVMEEENGQES